jgi:hypothetical protein
MFLNTTGALSTPAAFGQRFMTGFIMILPVEGQL